MISFIDGSSKSNCSLVPVPGCSKRYGNAKPLACSPTISSYFLEFEVQIIESLKLATEKASVAKDAKLKTISALQKHSTLLREAVDQGLPNHGDNVDWGKVENAASHVEEFSKQDLVAEAEARKSIDLLKTVIFL